MSLTDNFASDFVDLIRKEGSKNNPESIQIGIIKSLDPLQVAIGELALDKSDLYYDERIFGYIEFAEINYPTDNDLVHRNVQIKHNSIVNLDSKLLLYKIGNKHAVLGVI